MKYFKNMMVATALLPVALLCSAQQSPKDQRSFSSTEVAPGIYMLIGVGGFTGGNIGLSIGDDAVVMIDDSMPPLFDIMKTANRSVTDKPVDFLINTHIHGDHTGNNQSMGSDGTRIVAHENLRLNMLKKGLMVKGVKQPMPKAALPVITFSHAISFHFNGEDTRIFHVKKAHTDGDAVIHYQNANVIHTGDTFFNGMFPYIDIDNGGSVDGFIAAQQKILSLVNEQTKIIPGHGPLADKKQLSEALAMLIDARKMISDLIAEGKTENDVLKANPLKKYDMKWSWAFITTEKMTRQIYRSLKS